MLLKLSSDVSKIELRVYRTVLINLVLLNVDWKCRSGHWRRFTPSMSTPAISAHTVPNIKISVFTNLHGGGRLLWTI